jgi:hypothetical protein
MRCELGQLALRKNEKPRHGWAGAGWMKTNANYFLRRGASSGPMPGAAKAGETGSRNDIGLVQAFS